MKSEIRLKLSALHQDLDKVLATIGALLSIFIIIFLLTYKNLLGYFPTNLIIFTFLILFFCVLWLVYKKNNFLEYYLPGSKLRVKFWALCFFFLYILSFFAVYCRPNLYERPLIYFILTILMAGAIACEICTAERKHSGVILVQILLLGFSLTASLQLIIPSLIGGDPWYHFDLTNRIFLESYIPGGYIYSTMPIFHILSDIFSVITTLTYKFSTLISISFIQITMDSIFIFLISNFLFKNHRIALLSALLVIIGDQNITRSIAPIPNSFGYIFILIITYILFTRYHDANKVRTWIILVLFFALLILIHSLPALIMTVFLFFIWACHKYLKKISLQDIPFIPLLIPIGFLVAMLSWWYYVSSQGLAVTRILAEALNYDVDTYSILPDITLKIIDPNELLHINLGLYLFISISLFGFLYMVSKKGSNFTFYFAFISIIPFVIYVILYIFSGFVYDSNFNALTYRWVNLIQIVICIPLALSIYLIGTYKNQTSISSSLFFGTVVIILSFFMIMTPTGSPDGHIIGSSKYWSYYSESELSGNDFFGYRSTGDLYSDRDHAVSTSSSVFQHVYGIDSSRLHMLDFQIQSGIFTHDNSIKIFRTRRIAEFQRVGVISPNIQPDLNTYMSKNGFNKIYQSPAMTGYCR